MRQKSFFNALNRYSYALLFLLPLLGCNTAFPFWGLDGKKENDKQSARGDGNSQAVKSQDVQIFDKGSPEEAVWKQFFSDGRYRIVREDDFKLPIAVKQARYWVDVKRFVELPCVSGDFNGDGALDRACIVIDSTKETDAKYGVIIVEGTRSQSDNQIIKRQPVVRWLFKDRDLSKTILSYTLRGGLSAQEYKEDSSFVSCRIGWSSLQQKYTCSNPTTVTER